MIDVFTEPLVWIFIVYSRLDTSLQMVVCSVGITSHVAEMPLDKCRTADSILLTIIFFSEFFGEINKTNMYRRIIHYQDNVVYLIYPPTI